MKPLSNIRVYELAESIYASGYPMMVEIPQGEEWQREVDKVAEDIKLGRENPHVKRAIKLANSKGGGHDQFLTGILVSFDLTLTNKMWVEAERYTFLNFVSSQSTMHRITQMNIKGMCSEQVDQRCIDVLNEKIDKYNQTKSLEDFQEVLDNIPSGFTLTARMTTNYRCIRNMYHQRKTHRNFWWRAFCKQADELPMARPLIMGVVE
jgi:hypothetical protein